MNTPKFNYGSAETLSKGDKVRIISLTDVDTKEPDTAPDAFNLLGSTGTVEEPVLCDYYDCTIKLDKPLAGLQGYGQPPVLAMLYCDLEKIK